MHPQRAADRLQDLARELHDLENRSRAIREAGRLTMDRIGEGGTIFANRVEHRLHDAEDSIRSARRDLRALVSDLDDRT